MVGRHTLRFALRSSQVVHFNCRLADRLRVRETHRSMAGLAHSASSSIVKVHKQEVRSDSGAQSVGCVSCSAICRERAHTNRNCAAAAGAAALGCRTRRQFGGSSLPAERIRLETQAGRQAGRLHANSRQQIGWLAGRAVLALVLETLCVRLDGPNPAQTH